MFCCNVVIYFITFLSIYIMDEFIIAQAIGFVGYSIVAIAPRFKKRNHILMCEALGCAITALQWFLLDLFVATLIDSITAYTALTGVVLLRYPILLPLQKLCYPMLGAAAIASFDGSLTYYVAIALSLSLITAKMFKDMIKLRLMSLVVGALWITFAVLAGSIPSLIFAIIYTAGHIYQLLKLYNITVHHVVSRVRLLT